MELVPFFALAFVVAFIVAKAAKNQDPARIETYFRMRGERLLHADWKPLNAGWWLGRQGRVYAVRFMDSGGREHEARCRTDRWTGVYLNADTIVQSGAGHGHGPAPLAGLPARREEFSIHGLDHVQLAMPVGEEDAARRFYGGLLGLTELAKPATLAARGGVWFAGGTLRLHLGVEADFRPAHKAHPALLVRGLDALIAHLERAGVPVLTDEPLEGYRRGYVADPFGNRVELLEPVA